MPSGATELPGGNRCEELSRELSRGQVSSSLNQVDVFPFSCYYLGNVLNSSRAFRFSVSLLASLRFTDSSFTHYPSFLPSIVFLSLSSYLLNNFSVMFRILL